jgi:uncharacterized protein YchJ
VIVFLVMMATLASISAACGGKGTLGGSDEQQVIQLFKRQQALFKAENWSELYKTYSPSLRAQCSFDAMRSSWDHEAQRLDLTEMGYRNLKVTVTGDAARATFIATYQGDDVTSFTDSSPYPFRRINGVWYTDFDVDSGCE